MNTQVIFSGARLFTVILLLTGCATGPRITAVWHEHRFHQVGPFDRNYFVTDRASGLPVANPPLPPTDQGEYFWVQWTPPTIDSVTLEYRQINVPNKITCQTFTPARRQQSTTFAVTGDHFRDGGPVSAWRVRLYRGDQLLTEKQSALW